MFHRVKCYDRKELCCDEYACHLHIIIIFLPLWSVYCRRPSTIGRVPLAIYIYVCTHNIPTYVQHHHHRRRRRHWNKCFYYSSCLSRIYACPYANRPIKNRTPAARARRNGRAEFSPSHFFSPPPTTAVQYYYCLLLLLLVLLRIVYGYKRYDNMVYTLLRCYNNIKFVCMEFLEFRNAL